MMSKVCQCCAEQALHLGRPDGIAARPHRQHGNRLAQQGLGRRGAPPFQQDLSKSYERDAEPGVARGQRAALEFERAGVQPLGGIQVAFAPQYRRETSEPSSGRERRSRGTNAPHHPGRSSDPEPPKLRTLAAKVSWPSV
jgi:hypothetical protein